MAQTKSIYVSFEIRDIVSGMNVIETTGSEAGDIPEQDWINAAAANPAFDFLKDEAEDIYTLADGKPFQDQR